MTPSACARASAPHHVGDWLHGNEGKCIVGTPTMKYPNIDIDVEVWTSVDGGERQMIEAVHL